MAFRQSRENRRINKTKVDMFMDEKVREDEGKARQEFLRSLKVETKEIDKETGKEIINVEYDVEKMDDTELRKNLHNEIIRSLKTFRKLEKNGDENLPDIETQNEIIKQYLRKVFGKSQIFAKLEMFTGSWIDGERKKFDLADKNKLPNRPSYDPKNTIYKDDDRIYGFEKYFKSYNEKQEEEQEH